MHVCAHGAPTPRPLHFCSNELVDEWESFASKEIRLILWPRPLRYIPQRWILYIFTVPHMMYLLSQMSDYTTWQWLVVVLQNMVMLAAGGIATVPGLPWNWKGEMTPHTES